MFYMHSAGLGWGWWLLMSIGMIAFWGLVIFAVVWLVRRRPTDQPKPTSSESPEEIVKRRLATSEISLDEYERAHTAMVK